MRCGVRGAPRSALTLNSSRNQGKASDDAQDAGDSDQPIPAALDFFGDQTSRKQDNDRPPKNKGDSADDEKEEDDAPCASAELRSALPPKLAEAMSQLGVTSLTSVQRRTYALLESKDVLVVAPTGSGKTYAYVLPLLAPLIDHDRKDKNTRVLILVPTRELATQVASVVMRIIRTASLRIRVREVASKQTAKGGGAQIVIATPMAAGNALATKRLDIGLVRHVVLDEADRLLDDAFLAQVDTVMAAAGQQAKNPPRVHMFSATLPGGIEVLARGLLNDPVKIVVAGGAYGGAAAVTGLSAHIEQRFEFVGGRGEQGKVLAVRQMMRSGLKPPVLVFVQSRHRAAMLFRELVYEGIAVDAIHADRTDKARENAIRKFREGTLWMLIATDVLARGLDFLGVNTVINYDVPASPMAYVHRIGRTGRNGRNGLAITLFTEEDKLHLPRIFNIAKASGAEIPEWAHDMKMVTRKEKVKKLEKRPPKRKRLGGPNAPKITDRDQEKTTYRLPKVRDEEDEGEGRNEKKKRRKSKEKKPKISLGNDED